MQHLKEHFLAEALGGEGDGTPHPPSVNGAPKLAGGLIAPESVWACTTCLACMDCCAVWNEQVPAIVQLRRHLVGQGALPPGVQDVLDKLNRYGNAFGKSDRLRARWAQACGVKIKDARKEPVELVWFVGDYASFDPRCDAVTRATARVFHQAGLDFGLLYDGERNAGNDVRRIGEEGLFEVLREKNQQALAKVRWKNGQRALVTTDPHSYNTLKHEYHWAEEVRVLHSTELFERLFTEGRLQVRKRLTQRVTYHDPCYLGRYNGVYAPPRRVLARLGLEVVEMPRHHHRSYCCGAGGGRIWMDDTGKPRERPAESRVREAASLSGVSVLVVACPKDIAMFGDALKTTGQEGTLAVKEVAELVWEAVASPEPQPAT